MLLQIHRVADQPTQPFYWGRMRFLGRVSADVCKYAVDFGDHAPHLRHHHRQDELITVAQGSIEQVVYDGSGAVTHREVLHAGDDVHLPAGTWHSATPLEPGTRVVFTITGGDGIYRAYEEGSDEPLVGPGV